MLNIDCNRRLSVKYTYRRQITTLHGTKNTIIKVLAREDNPEEHICIQDGTEAPLIPKCDVDINLIVLIGLLRWRLGMKRLEIRAFLETKSIFLSTGTISNRSLDFLLLFKQLHLNKRHEIKALIEREGCMIIHMDGTHRSGGRVV